MVVAVKSRTRILWVTALFSVAVLFPAPASAYIGPGAGFAFAGSLLVLVATVLLAGVTILTWPITLLYRLMRVGNPYKNAKTRRVVVIGFDGMDPKMALRLIQEGRLPNLKRLAEQGVFRTLDTTTPSMSPVAWSTFATGVDASRHRIFDFITRDPCTCAPILSSTDIRAAKRSLRLGRYVIPIDQPRIKLLQRSEWFWKHLGDKHIASIIQRVPITFPPKPFNGLMLSGMCVPDMRGSQGTFSFFTTRSEDGGTAFEGGEQTLLRRTDKNKGIGKSGKGQGERFRTRIVGPENTMLKTGGRMTLPMTLTVAEDSGSVLVEVDGLDSFSLKPRVYSFWKRLSFRAMPGVKVHGIARFYLVEVGEEISLYLTPIQIDPENPAMPISHPKAYSIYLAKKIGLFGTLGLAEDTWALNERVIDEQAFLQQANLLYEEREKMFWDALQKTKRGLVTTVFDTTDRVQHMFYRYLDPTHPANEGKDTTEHRDAIAQAYVQADELVGKTLAAIGGTDTTLCVISDHGFTNFRRGVNLNAWMRDEGYLVLKEGTTSGDWLENVDWAKTRAFSLGLAGIFINRKGREKCGIVAEGEEYRTLVTEIQEKLEALKDPKTGESAIRSVDIAESFFDGPYRFDAPDLMVGYDVGYRSSWDCAKGAVTQEAFVDNTKSWSGDHCVDPEIVPGVLFCNRPIVTDKPRLVDMPFSIMKLFGQEPPGYMQGRMIFADGEKMAEVFGVIPIDQLDQRGAVQGTMAHVDWAGNENESVAS